jgi:Arc/MetJ-type ribon-helix-helix transcriptional regulator
MPKRKKFEVRVTVSLPPVLAEFVEDMVRMGRAESLSQAIRRCVSIAKEYMPEVSVKVEGEKKEVR